MKAGGIRGRLLAAIDIAMRSESAEEIAWAADRAKVTGAALAGVPDKDDVTVAELELRTRGAATVLGFHPEHVRRLVRQGRIPARRVGGDYRVRVDDLLPLLEARGRRRSRA